MGGIARRLVPAGIAFLLAVVLLAPATVGGKILSAGDMQLSLAPLLTVPAGTAPQNGLQFDSAFVFEPDALFVRDALRQGRLPLWSDALSAGRPLLAAQQSAPLFPLTWLGVLFPFWESLAWIVVLKLTISTLGTVLLARALGLGLGPSLMAGIAFGFGTYMVDWLLHPHSNAYILLPWLFLTADRLCRTGAVRDAALLAAVVGGTYLSGHPQSAFLVSLAVAGWFFYRLAAARCSRRDALARVGLAAGATGLGLALAAVMLVPFVEGLRESYDTSRAQDPLAPRAALSIFFPEYWGRPDRANTASGPSNFTERTLYVGVFPLLLAVAGCVARRPRPPQLFFAALFAVAMAIVLDTGFLSETVGRLPGLDTINLNRLLVLASFALALLSGFGAELLLRGTGSERKRMLVAAGATAALPVLVVLAAHPGWLEDLFVGFKRMLGLATPQTGEVIALASLLRWLVLSALAVALMAVLTRWRRYAVLAVAAALALVALDLLVMGYGYNPAITKAEATPPTPPAVTAMREMTREGGRVVGIGALEPNTASRWGLDDARGHEQPAVERQQRLWYALGGGTEGATPGVSGQDPRTPGLLDVFGVRAVLLNPLFVDGTEPVFAPALRGDPVAYSRPDGVVLDHRTALPPAFVAYRWRASAGLDESLGLMVRGNTRLARDRPVVETGTASPATTRPATPARIVSRTDTEVVLDVSARERGQLVLLDTFYPGWKAEVDGESADIRPANAAFRAVPVDAGRHEVRFSYRPTSVVLGAVISLVALVVLAGLLLIRRRRA